MDHNKTRHQMPPGKDERGVAVRPAQSDIRVVPNPAPTLSVENGNEGSAFAFASAALFAVFAKGADFGRNWNAAAFQARRGVNG